MCLQADQAHFVTGYNGGAFSVSDDNPDAGPFLTYCWTGPCKAPDVNFGELAVHMYWRLMYSHKNKLTTCTSGTIYCCITDTANLQCVAVHCSMTLPTSSPVQSVL